MTANIQDPTKLITTLYRFLAFVRSRDGDRPLTFVDQNTFLGREENYKAKASELARGELDYDKWDESWIGTGKILERCKRAMDRAGNLVFRNQQIQFKNMIDPKSEKFKPNAEHVLYDIYRSTEGDEEAAAFSQARKTFGGHYDTIAYLFFVKDASRFLPISPGNFERSLSSVGINYPLSGQCSWLNYAGFIDIVKDVQSIMQKNLSGIDIRLIDAHSFLWVINEEAFHKWEADVEEAEIEISTENYLTAKAADVVARESRITSYFARSTEVIRETKKRANGVCQLCGKPAPFMDKHGIPYLETHHIVWLSRGGEDSTNNTVALCPNCHTKMHIVDDKADVKVLLDIVK